MRPNQLAIKVSLFLNYFVFAILLNSVGTVILQVQNSLGVSAASAAVLEAFKDLPIAVASFLVASFAARIGFRHCMQLALLLVIAGCLAMPLFPQFWMSKLLFAMVGVSFALVKVSTFAVIGLVTDSDKAHASLMSFLESFFMVGVLSGYFIFGAFVDNRNPQSLEWLDVYYVLASLSLIALLLVSAASLDESGGRTSDATGIAGELAGMLALCARPLVIVFVVSAFLYVLIEQSIMSWLPSFNSRSLNLAPVLSIQMASILAAATAFGRFAAGVALRHVNWYPLLSVGLLAAAGLILIAMPMVGVPPAEQVGAWRDAPLAAFLFPLIGFCIAPVYPVINSVMLSALPKPQHAPMAGLIVVFSALGGTTGSLITGHLFEAFGGRTAFYSSLLPIGLILYCLHLFRRQATQA